MSKAKVILQLNFCLLLIISILLVFPQSIKAGEIGRATPSLSADYTARGTAIVPVSTPPPAATATTMAPNPLEPTVRQLYFLVGGLVFLTIVLIIVVVFLLRRFRRY
jgi:hypothetical protein